MEAHVVPGLERARAADPDTPRDQRIELFTSGTTGPPKQRAFPYDFFSRSHVLPPMLARPDTNWQAEPPPYLPYPVGNISGMMSLLPALLRGQPILFPDRFTLDGWRDWIARTRPVFAGIAPAGIRMILDAQLPKEELSFVKFIATGGGPVEAEDMRRLKQEYGITVLLAYGATEFGGTVVSQGPEVIAKYGDSKFGSAGQAVPGAKIRVIDPETHEVLGPNQVGILEVVSPMMGPEWIRTSDLAEIDADGFMFHRGRADGAIVRGGFKLVPEVIERALMSHPAVAVAAVVGRKDRRLGQVPAAMIQLDPNYDGPAPDFAALEAHLRAQLPATHVPVDWKLVEAIPRTPSFKIDRVGIRKQFEEEAGVG
jgi:acyl-coenzyme A synthetase/AMP-(fatty) acid ligase